MQRVTLLPLILIVAFAPALVVGCSDDDGGNNQNQNQNLNDAGVNSNVDGATSDAGPEALIPPDEPPMSDLRFDVHSAEDRHAISPYIYGVNAADDEGLPSGITCWRAGGSRWTAYNWENNASNAGSDWNHQNDGYLGGGDTPGEAVRARVAAAHALQASILVTVPIQGFVAADKLADGDVANTPNYFITRFRPSEAVKGGSFVYPPDAEDGVVYQDEFVHWLEHEFQYARTDPTRTIFYSLDNEPDLWSSTHPRVHPDAVTYAELMLDTLTYAAAIKDVAPAAKIFGPVNYGWQGMMDLQSAPDAGGREFLAFYLQSLAQAEQDEGRRLVDVLDVHWYPEARGGGVRITTDDATPEVAAARVQAPRSLWDPSYTEESWIAQDVLQGPITLLPRIQGLIDQHDPGTRIAVSEYYYGGGDHISGGIAQADVLGIFAREDVFAAHLWRLGNTDQSFIWAAFRMYRDFDGAGSAFGNTSIGAVTDSWESSSVHASVDAANPDRMVIVAINRVGFSLSAGLSITHTRRFHTMHVWRLTAAHAGPVADADIPITLTNAVQVTLPAESVTTFELVP